MTDHLTKSAARLFLCAAATLAAAFATPAVAQTQFTTGAAEVRAFVARSATQVYAAAYGGGLFVSNDGGASWTRVDILSNGFRYLTGIAGNSSIFMVIGSEEGLVTTTNGTTFTFKLAEPISAVAVGFGASQRAVAAVKGHGIVRSLDGGATWTLANTSALDSLDIVSLAFDPSNPDVIFAAARPDATGARGGVFRSQDAGATWASFNGTGLPAGKYVAALAVDTAATVFAGILDPGTGGGAVYMRPLASGTWTATTGTFFGIASLHRDANSGTQIWAGTRGLGVLRGAGAGLDNSSYAYSNPGTHNLFYTGVNAVVSLPGTTIALKALKGAGVWRTTIAPPGNWARVSFPGADRVLSASNIGNALPNSMLAGLHAGGVWRTDNGGASWSPPTETAGQQDFSFRTGFVNHFLSVWDLAASVSNPNHIYAAAGGVGMYYLNDTTAVFRWNGAQWGAVGNDANAGGPAFGQVEPGTLTTPSAQPYGVALNRADESVAYVGFLAGTNTFMRRVGGTWSIVGIPSITPQVRRINTTASAPANVLALLTDNKPVLSTNSGASFTEVSVNQFGYERLRFYQASDNPTAGNVWIGATSKGLFRSIDNGASWGRVTGAIFVTQALSAVGHKPSGLAYAADFEGNRYCSNNQGVTWTALLPKLRAGVNAIKVVGTQLYYLTDGAGMQREDAGC